jgi:hypothetical protein
MKRLIAGAAFALAACGPMEGHGRNAHEAGDHVAGDQGAGLQGATPLNSATDPSIVGAWSDTGDCAHVTHINSDGFYVGERGRGRWTIAGNRLTMQGPHHATTVTMRWIDADHVELTLADGNGGVSTRCPGA